MRINADRQTITVIISGKGQIAVRCLFFCLDLINLIEFPLRLVGLPVTSDRGEDGWQPSLLKACRSQNIEYHRDFEEIKLSPKDVFFSLEYDRIIKLEQLNGCRAFNIHFSLLPKYRGCHTSVWPIRNGESYSGVTLHKIDQVTFEIPPFFTAQNLYEACHEHGFQLYKRNLCKILKGEESYCDQDPREATFFSRASIDYFKDIQSIDFSKPAVSVCNYIRSLIFPVFQCPIFKGKKIFHAEIVFEIIKRDLSPGMILSENTDRALVVCGDGQVIRIHFHPEER